MTWHNRLRGGAGRGLRWGSRTELFEPLERRELLAYDHPMLSDLPPATVLEDPRNTVVRFQTSFGNIDLELFDTVAPITVANFLQYVHDGAYDQMFFHRLVDDFVLQGGGFKFTDSGGKSDVPTRDPIQNEFRRSNLEGTVAMARFQGQPNSATNQFFINLKDNPALDLVDGGFTVFGAVIGGWDVVTTISNLNVRDYDVQFTGSPFGSQFDTVPVSGDAPAGAPVRERDLVLTWDAEVIKPYGTGLFYTRALYSPEGFRSGTVTERIDMQNANTTFRNWYQIVVRYENGDRDRVVATGILNPDQRRSIKIVGAGVDLVRAGVGYAIEVRSTQVLAASLNHRDNGVTLGESLISTAHLTDAQIGSWSFAGGEKRAGHEAFLLWDNLGDSSAVVYVTVYPQSLPPVFLEFPVERYRRGGVALHEMNAIPGNRAFSVRVTSNRPIVASMSRYETQGSGHTGTTNGSIDMGVPLSGLSEGYLAAARIPPGSTTTLSVMYTTPTPAQVLVDFTFYLPNGTTLAAPAAHLTSTVRRKDVNLASMNVNLPTNLFFSIGYKVRGSNTPVVVALTQEYAGDTMSTPFITRANNYSYFADGFIDPAQVGVTYTEIISVFNPYRDGDVQFTYGIIIQFQDGTKLPFTNIPLGPLGRADIRPNQLPGVMDIVNSNPQNRFYSVLLGMSQTRNGVPFAGAGVTQLTRVHAQSSWKQTMTSGPMMHPELEAVSMNSGQFD